MPNKQTHDPGVTEGGGKVEWRVPCNSLLVHVATFIQQQLHQVVLVTAQGQGRAVSLCVCVVCTVLLTVELHHVVGYCHFLPIR